MSKQNVLDRLMGSPGSVGDVDIGDVDIGDPVEAAAALKAALYADRPFNREDEVNVGLYDGVVIVPGGTHDLVQQVDNPFKPLAVVFPSWQCPGMQITSIRIAAVNLVEGGPIPADIYNEASTKNAVSWPTVQTSGRIIVTIFNNSSANVTPNLALKGRRIRGA